MALVVRIHEKVSRSSREGLHTITKTQHQHGLRAIQRVASGHLPGALLQRNELSSAALPGRTFQHRKDGTRPKR